MAQPHRHRGLSHFLLEQPQFLGQVQVGPDIDRSRTDDEDIEAAEPTDGFDEASKN